VAPVNPFSFKFGSFSDPRCVGVIKHACTVIVMIQAAKVGHAGHFNLLDCLGPPVV
jgi:hypothetical protein